MAREGKIPAVKIKWTLGKMFLRKGKQHG